MLSQKHQFANVIRATNNNKKIWYYDDNKSDPLEVIHIKKNLRPEDEKIYNIINPKLVMDGPFVLEGCDCQLCKQYNYITAEVSLRRADAREIVRKGTIRPFEAQLVNALYFAIKKAL